MTWRAQWQNYKGWRTQDVKEPHPPIMVGAYPEREDAQREVRLQQAAGMVACVTPVPVGRRLNRRTKLTPIAWPIAHKSG